MESTQKSRFPDISSFIRAPGRIASPELLSLRKALVQFRLDLVYMLLVLDDGQAHDRFLVLSKRRRVVKTCPDGVN
jgi:hypothetical protein